MKGKVFYGQEPLDENILGIVGIVGVVSKQAWRLNHMINTMSSARRWLIKDNASCCGDTVEYFWVNQELILESLRAQILIFQF